MKFSWYFENIKNIEWYPVVGLALFMLVFLAMLTLTYRKKEKYYFEQKNIPLDYENK
jgi:cbb3-type cytochrome oxidase subunit 3